MQELFGLVAEEGLERGLSSCPSSQVTYQGVPTACRPREGLEEQPSKESSPLHQDEPIALDQMTYSCCLVPSTSWKEEADERMVAREEQQQPEVGWWETLSLTIFS